jgi:hypothetical protein
MQIEEAWFGDSLVAFDGRVLEVFGFPGSESLRYHVRNMEVEVGEPDRRGRRAVTFKPASRGSGGCRLELAPDDWPAAEALIERVMQAMPG